MRFIYVAVCQSNILASMTGTPLLVDFGFSRIVVSDKDGLGDVLNTVNFYGTAAWTAIELLSDPTDSAEVPLQTKQSDVWAFAMTVVVRSRFLVYSFDSLFIGA